MKDRFVLSLLLSIGLLSSGGCIFSPDKHPPVTPPDYPAPTTPALVLDNVKQAMERRVIEEFEDLLDPNYIFSEPSLVDSLSFIWGRDVERRTVDAIFRTYSTFTFDYRPVFQRIEPKEEYPATLPDGTPNEDGHPDEDWVVMYGLVQMTMRDETGENGYDVSQKMEFKLRKTSEVAKDPKTGAVLNDPDGNPLYLWKIIRWIDRVVE